MEAKELRIDNLISLSKYTRGIRMPYGAFRVLTLSFFDLECLPIHINPVQSESFIKEEYSQIEPIVLTEDWLIKKLGFKNDREDVYYKGKVFLVKVPTGYKLLGVSFPNDEVGVVIKHAHHLQNLYFELVGEELQINLEQLT